MDNNIYSQSLGYIASMVTELFRVINRSRSSFESFFYDVDGKLTAILWVLVGLFLVQLAGLVLSFCGSRGSEVALDPAGDGIDAPHPVPGS